MTQSMNKRRIAGLALIVFALVLAFGCLAGCSSEQSSSNEQQASEPSVEVQDEQAAEPEGGSPKVLLAYFSRAGENYNTDRTDVGNTAIVAGFIEDALGCDTYEIVPAVPYPYDYDETTALAQDEKDADARPEIANPMPNLADYDVVLLGSPIWWGEEPMIVRTFLESGDFSGKVIYPFTTHGGSGLGSVVSDYRELAPGADVSSDGLAITGSNAEGSQEQVDSWLEQIGLLER